MKTRRISVGLKTLSLTALCASTLPLGAQNLIQHWKLDDSTLNYTDNLAPLVNQVVGGSQAYVNNGTNASPAPLANQAGARVSTGNSILLQNQYEHIELGGVAPGAGAFTMAFWFNRDSAATSGFDLGSTQEHIVSANQAQTGRWNLNAISFNSSTETFSLQLFSNPGGWTGSGTTSSYTLATGLSSDTWYHFAMTRDDANGFKLYVNGVEKFFGTNPNSFTQGTSGVWLGLDPGLAAPSRSFTGAFDDVRVYDGPLEAGQVMALIPEPSALSLLLFASGVMAVVANRKRAN